MPAATETPITDVLIIGGSHAGLSAALTLYRVLHTCIIFDSGAPRNHYSTAVRLTSTWEARTPEEMKDASRKELLDAGFTQFVDAKIVKVQRTSDGLFEVADETGTTWLGRKLLLAMGTRDVFPEIPGYADIYARGIYPCMFQFGFELRGSASAGALAADAQENPQFVITRAYDSLKFADRVTVYTNANSALAAEVSGLLNNPAISVDDKKLKRLSRGDEEKRSVLIEFEDGSEIEESFLVHVPKTQIDRTLVDQLGVQTSKMGHIEAPPPFCQTNVPGVFAAGDCAHFMRVIPSAMSMGAYAGCGIARELGREVMKPASN